MTDTSETTDGTERERQWARGPKLAKRQKEGRRIARWWVSLSDEERLRLQREAVEKVDAMRRRADEKEGC